MQPKLEKRMLGTPNEERPVPCVSENYVPPGGVRYPIHTGDTWIKIANAVGIDPWDLIDFNFPGTKGAMQNNHERGARQVNWYLREYVGCRTTTDGENWTFNSGLTEGKGSWKGGVIYIPMRKGPPVLPIRRINQSIAAVTWVDPRPADGMKRSQLLARTGYMCVNFLEASITAVTTNKGLTGYANGSGFTSDSGAYEGATDGRTYQLYPVKRTQETLADGIKFTQIVGVLDRSAMEAVSRHALPSSWGGIAEQLFRALRAKQTEFLTPPVWSELTLTMYFNGTYDAAVTSFSLFPNVSLYHGGAFTPSISLDGGKTWSHNVPWTPQEKAEDYIKEEVSEDSAIRNFTRWQTDGWGSWRATRGNPWGARPYPFWGGDA
jgi:hypothetical protein